MSALEEILSGINAQRAALLHSTGGAQAPDPVAPDMGGAQAADTTGAEDRLAKALKTLRQNGAGPAHGIPGLKKFGGEILGYGEHQDADPGHSGTYAVIKRDGKLFHLFDDGTKMKIDQGAVARALGIKAKVAQIVGAGAAGGISRGGAVGNGTGGAMAPALGAAAPGGAEDSTVLPGLGALTGGAAAPGTTQGLSHAGMDGLDRLRQMLRSRA